MVLQSPFHAYYAARMLERVAEKEQFVPVFASSGIQVYPFQVAAAGFALRSPYQKGVILCDEAGMGKSHEAMLVMVQRWMEGQNRILLCIPNADLLAQWVELLEQYYTVPYITLTNKNDWAANSSSENPNAFDHSGIVITTYDFAADHAEEAGAIAWDLTVFEEANALSGVYQAENKQAKALHQIAGNAFKLLLTGTPIEKNIMDLYGLIYFIDDTVLPGEQEFLSRYLRKPENYPELAKRISKYCFRTLRSQARSYAKIPSRVLVTHEYQTSQQEKQLHKLLSAYIDRPDKLAFPEMDSYDLALRLFGLLGSSTAALSQAVKGILKRLESNPEGSEECAQLTAILDACVGIKEDSKAKALMIGLEKGFVLLKQKGAARKAVLFTESIETQKMLLPIVSRKYKAVIYNGSKDYSAIREFLQTGEVLITTDSGAKGFHLAAASFVIHYDLLYNTLKMEQRIDRCHRLGQQNDVLSLAFINKENFADVRKLELVSKRMLVSDGVFGVSDDVIGGFTEDLPAAMDVISQRVRSKAQIEEDHQRTLTERSDDNKKIVQSAEEILFTTFHKDIASQMRITPQYIEDRSAEINHTLWELAKYFFQRYNAEHTDCYYVIDEDAQTITATNYETLPTLFYYWDGSRNKKYQSQKAYGMAKDFKPRHGRITLTSIIGRGILHELECAERGELEIRSEELGISGSEIGLYFVELFAGKKRVLEKFVLCGRKSDGTALSEEECARILQLPVVSYTDGTHKAPHWLKQSGRSLPLDHLVPVDALIAEEAKKLSPAREEEISRLKQKATAQKVALTKEVEQLSSQLKALESGKAQVTNDRLKLLSLDKQIAQFRRTYMAKQESQFFDAMKIDLEMEEKIKALMEKDSLSAGVTREFVIQISMQHSS